MLYDAVVLKIGVYANVIECLDVWTKIRNDRYGIVDFVVE